MAVDNPYNPNPQTVDSLLRERQARADSERANTPIETPQPETNTQPDYVPSKLAPGTMVKSQQKFLKDVTTENPNDGFGTRVGKDAALLAYAIPVGVAKLATGIVTHPIDTFTEVIDGFAQSVKDLGNAEYYKKHPLLATVNVASFVQPVASVAKSSAIKSATRSAVETSVREANRFGIEDSVARSIFKEDVFHNAVTEAYKKGEPKLVSEVVRNLGVKNGMAEDQAIRIGNSVADELYSTLSQSSTKMKALEAIQHPLGTAFGAIADKTDPLRKTIFGSTAETAVARMYGTETVLKNPEGFLGIEKWAEAQVKERGFSNTIDNRQRMMQEWVEQNSQWASLTPEERVSHFQNYADADLKRLQLHNDTGLDIVTVKALPQNYVDAMVQTIKDAPNDIEMSQLAKKMEDTYGRDYTNHSAEINAALLKNPTKEGMIEVISKLGNSRSNVSFVKYSKATQELADSLEKTGYRIGLAPADKNVSFAADVMASKANVKAAEENAGKVVHPTDVTHSNIMAKRTAFGAWIDKLGLSPNGLIEGAPEFAFREGFTQLAMNKLPEKFGTIIRAGDVSIPVEKLFDWLDKNRIKFQESRPRYSLPIRTVFDIKKDDLIRAGMSEEVAKDIISISKKALSETPQEVTGMADKFINYLRTRDEGYNAWMSNVYDKYLRIAYKGRYDWSPFFSFQQWLETNLNSALFLKDTRFVPGVRTAQKIGGWTAEKLGKRVAEATPYLRKIIEEPPIEEVAAVKDEILGSLSKTMLDFTSSPDPLATRTGGLLAEDALEGGRKLLGLKERSKFEKSIASENAFYHLTGQSNVRMATTFNKALAERFGMTLPEALAYKIEDGIKVYKNPQLVQMMREATQSVYHYQPGLLTSPLMKTMNVIWFPLRFQAKTTSMIANWLGTLSPASRMVVMNNWVHFANWAGTEEGRKWRLTNRNAIYNILSYSTAYEQIGQAVDAVTKGRFFGGNAGMIGGVPLGFFVNLARELSIIESDPDQFDPKTGKPFSKFTPKELVSLATLSSAIEQLTISVMPSTPFYSLTGGTIVGISPSKLTTPLIRQVVGTTAAKIQGENVDTARKKLDREFKKVPADYNRFGN